MNVNDDYKIAGFYMKLLPLGRTRKINSAQLLTSAIVETRQQTKGFYELMDIK